MTPGVPPERLWGETPAWLALAAPFLVAATHALAVPELAWVGVTGYALLLFAPAIDPKRRVRWDGKPLPATRLGLAVVCSVGALLQLRARADAAWVAEVDGLAAVVLLGVLGNAMPALRPNWFFGIRTPWTLRDDAIWERTHRVGGHALVVTSALLVGLWAALDASWFAVAGVALPVGVLVGLGAYSWWLAARRA